MILAGIVLYNPDINRLEQNIKKIIKQVDEIILIDNNSSNSSEILKEFGKYNIITNSKNKGIAYALNQILTYAYAKKFEWFLTLDQDSVCFDNNLIKEYYKVLENKENVAMISCEIIDRNSGKIKAKNNEYKIKEVDVCITSGTLNNTKILNELEGFDNKMFIDYVDYDICATVRENYYKILKINIYRIAT